VGWLIGIIVLGGVAGGVANFLIGLDQPDPNGGAPPTPAVSSWLRLWRSVFVGVVAAFLVPLLLNMVSSELLKNAATDLLSRFVLLGFCLAAAISSTAFIRTMTDRVLNLAREAKADAAKAQAEAADANRKADTTGRTVKAVVASSPPSGRIQAIDQAVARGTASAAPSMTRLATAFADSPEMRARIDAALEDETKAQAELLASDPLKGYAGGASEANSRRLTATIAPAVGPDHPACLVHLAVTSTDPRKHPLNGEVVFHLHPTFTPPVRRVVADGASATLDIISWGAFTVAADADGGRTKLELDLTTLPGGTPGFYKG
jgi:hypothetical protein